VLSPQLLHLIWIHFDSFRHPVYTSHPNFKQKKSSPLTKSSWKMLLVEPRKIGGSHKYYAIEDYLICGAGGIRTLVQTMKSLAFYMFSSRFDFRSWNGHEHPNHDLASSSFAIRQKPSHH